jgi:hypothetical protein
MIAVLRLASLAVLAIGAAACVDRARCDAALEGVARARLEAADRDRQVARLALSQAQLAEELRRGDREALLRRLAALEAENAELSARIEHAERALARARLAAALRRKIDEAVPYVPAKEEAGKDEGSILRRAARPKRQLDEAVPYEARAPSTSARTDEPIKRTLDEAVPY